MTPSTDPLESSLAAKLSRLEERLRDLAPVAVAFSGGVDSSVLYAEARRVLGDRARAVVGVSASLPRRELEEARTVAQHLGAPLDEIPTDELEDPDYRANAGTRCFYCKQTLYGRLGDHPELAGWQLCDGTHAEDPSGDRPGMRAAKEAGVASPLREVGLGKSEIRALALFRGLPNWERPARPCLASRIRVGTPVTSERLGLVEDLEEVLARAGFRVYRARLSASRGAPCVSVVVGSSEGERLGETAWRAELLVRAVQSGVGRLRVNVRGYGVSP